MTLQELEQVIAIDVAGSMQRFLDNENLYKKFLRKYLDDTNFALLKQAVQTGNWQEAELRAHTLKGVCGNLGLSGLYLLFSQLVKVLRAGDYAQAREKFLAAEKVNAEVLAAIERLQ